MRYCWIRMTGCGSPGRVFTPKCSRFSSETETASAAFLEMIPFQQRRVGRRPLLGSSQLVSCCRFWETNTTPAIVCANGQRHVRDLPLGRLSYFLLHM